MSEQCDFCSRHDMADRIIRSDELITSFVSNPRFREGQCLVIPNRHIVQIGELETDEAASVMLEIGRLATWLDRGFGYGVMEKFQPTQADNGIKVAHLHFHVFPRFEHEENLFPMPQPNRFEGFYHAPSDEIADLARRLT